MEIQISTYYRLMLTISILANAGGVGKSTLAIHLAYAVNRSGFSVAMLDLDPQHSLDRFCGLPPAGVEQSMAQILGVQRIFKGIGI